MMFRSEHYRSSVAASGFRVTIDRIPAKPRRVRDELFFQAHDQDGARLTVAIDYPAWLDLRSEFGDDALLELESLALAGRWEDHGADRVWRVILI